jgi:phage baseplate assembly protein W
MAIEKYVNRDPDYSDLDLDFVRNPTTGDVSRKVGTEAIKRSVRNLVFTNFYERKFRSDIGSDVTELLFDNITPLTTIYLQDAITSLINNFEPRVKLQSVDVKDDIDNNGYNITLTYVILNRNLPVVSTLFLERIR